MSFFRVRLLALASLGWALGQSKLGADAPTLDYQQVPDWPLPAQAPRG